MSFKEKENLFTFEIQYVSSRDFDLQLSFQDYPYLLDPNVTVMAYILSFINQG